MRIQKTFMEQIKDSSTPLNSPEPSRGDPQVGGGEGRLGGGELFSLLAWQEGRPEENRRGRSWAQTPRLLLPPFFWVPS